MSQSCQWCGAPATTTIEIEPVRYRSVTKTDPRTGERMSAKEVAQFAITAEVCDAHKSVRDRQGGQPITDLRRKKAKGVEQTSIFDVLGDDDSGPGNAIYGDAA